MFLIIIKKWIIISFCYLYCFRILFYVDVFRLFSWLVNICGRKKWIFYFLGEYYEDILVIYICIVYLKISLLYYKVVIL